MKIITYMGEICFKVDQDVTEQELTSLYIIQLGLRRGIVLGGGRLSTSPWFGGGSELGRGLRHPH